MTHDEEPEAHPLFPAESPDDDPPEVLAIHVRRDGQTFPRPFGPEELTSYEQIHALWGGGRYELIARNGKHITKKYAVVLPGKPKTFVSVSEDAEAGAEPSQHITIPAPPPAAPGESFSAVLPFMQMMAQMMTQQSQQQSQMLIALMTSGREQAQQHLQQMQMMHDRSAQQQMQMMATLMESQKGSRPDELILRGIELASQLGGGGGGESDGEGSELGELAEAAASIMQGVQGFAGMGPPQQAPNGQSQAPNGQGQAA